MDLQTSLIAQLNQTIWKPKEQIEQNSQNSSKPPSSDEFKKTLPKSLRKPPGKKVGGQDGHQGTQLAVVGDPDKTVKHMPAACAGCSHDKMCKGITYIAEKCHIIDIVVTVNVTESRLLKYQSVRCMEVLAKVNFQTESEQLCSMVKTCRH